MDPPADGRPRTVGMVILDPLLALAENDLRTRGQARPVMEELEHLAQARHLVIFLTHHANADGKAASSRADYGDCPQRDHAGQDDEGSGG